MFAFFQAPDPKTEWFLNQGALGVGVLMLSGFCCWIVNKLVNRTIKNLDTQEATMVANTQALNAITLNLQSMNRTLDEVKPIVQDIHMTVKSNAKGPHAG